MSRAMEERRGSLNLEQEVTRGTVCICPTMDGFLSLASRVNFSTSRSIAGRIGPRAEPRESGSLCRDPRTEVRCVRLRSLWLAQRRCFSVQISEQRGPLPRLPRFHPMARRLNLRPPSMETSLRSCNQRRPVSCMSVKTVESHGRGREVRWVCARGLP